MINTFFYLTAGRTPTTQRTGDRVGPRAGLDAFPNKEYEMSFANKRINKSNSEHSVSAELLTLLIRILGGPWFKYLRDEGLFWNSIFRFPQYFQENNIVVFQLVYDILFLLVSRSFFINKPIIRSYISRETDRVIYIYIVVVLRSC